MIPDRSTFESAYAGQAPWYIGRPNKVLVDVADRITGSVLDAGCGTGENALFFAGRGCRVTGIDFIEEAINRARRKAAERGVPATFMVKDPLTLKDWTERFDNVIDSGLFHVFNDEDRRRYVEGLATVLKPGGRLFLGCFSDEEPGTRGRGGCPRKNCTTRRSRGWASSWMKPSWRNIE
jgi:cyclopropane fatty-acyl-phospholipid synthase-like methyltransferase